MGIKKPDISDTEKPPRDEATEEHPHFIENRDTGDENDGGLTPEQIRELFTLPDRWQGELIDRRK